LLLSIAANIGLASYTYLLIKKTNTIKQSHPTTRAVQKIGQPKRVAILTPVSHPALEQIELGFKETLENNSSKPYKFTTYNANGSRTLMRSQVEEILQSKYDMLFTIATQPTKMAKEISEKKQNNIPIVFAAANDPDKLGVIQSMESSDNNVTGVTEENDFATQLDLLTTLKPETKNLLLVYSPSESSSLERDRDAVAQICKQKNINFKTIEVFHANEIYGKVSSGLSGVDVVMVLKDNTVVSGIDSLIKLCNQHNITLLATDLDSGDKGAALSFGVQEYDFGKDAAKKAMLILEDDQQPTNIPTTPVNEFKLKINTNTMQHQNVTITKQQLFLMSKSIIK
jgi:putative ABC transport system substrate-binding protein